MLEVLLALAPLAAPTDIPFDRLASDAKKRLGVEEASADFLDLEEAVTSSCVHLRVGLFDLYMAKQSAEDKTAAEHYVRSVQAVLTMQEAWLDWLEPVDEFEDARKDLKTLSKWVGGLRGGAVVKAAKADATDLMEALRAKGSVLEASERFATFMGSGAPLGLERDPQFETVVFAGTRTEYLEYMAFSGWLYPDLQSIYWQPDVVTWTNCYVDDVKFLAFEYASAFGAAHYSAGTSMDERYEDGLAQQITQLTANSLIDNYYGGRIPESLAGAMSINLTIDVFGTCATRVDGDLNSRRTEAYEMFVPGGASEGGWLPKVAAESRWRELQGSDRYIQILKTTQKNGSEVRKRIKGDHHFEIENDGKNRRIAVSGPFLGAAAAEAEVMIDEFVGDHKEFLRAYRTCFLYWLKEESQGKAKESRLTFATWLRSLAAGESDELEASMKEAFGAPLSAKELSRDVLEGAYLTWLTKARG